MKTVFVFLDSVLILLFILIICGLGKEEDLNSNPKIKTRTSMEKIKEIMRNKNTFQAFKKKNIDNLLDKDFFAKKFINTIFNELSRFVNQPLKANSKSEFLNFFTDKFHWQMGKSSIQMTPEEKKLSTSGPIGYVFYGKKEFGHVLFY